VLVHRDRLLRIARTRTSTAQDAEDCVQEAMLRCVEFPNLDESRLGPFLTTVTLRLCADRHRERAGDERLRLRLGFRDRDEPGPEEEICDRSEAAWLATRFGELTQRQQDIIRAREAGLSCAEVASQFKMTYVSVESSLSRARTRFREALAKTMGVLSPSAWRWATLVEAATVGAVAVGTLGSPPGALAGGPPPPVPPRLVIAVPHVPHRSVATHRTVVQHVAAAAAPRTVVVAAKPAALIAFKKPPPDPIVTTPGGWNVLGEDNTHPDDPSTPERLLQCLQYGIKTDPIECKHPDDPR
jgi:RNA polymerase sigma factor (sigma-70 family)